MDIECDRPGSRPKRHSQGSYLEKRAGNDADGVPGELALGVSA
jgi:hypothetical protein